MTHRFLLGKAIAAAYVFSVLHAWMPQQAYLKEYSSTPVGGPSQIGEEGGGRGMPPANALLTGDHQTKSISPSSSPASLPPSPLMHSGKVCLKVDFVFTGDKWGGARVTEEEGRTNVSPKVGVWGVLGLFVVLYFFCCAVYPIQVQPSRRAHAFWR